MVFSEQVREARIALGVERISRRDQFLEPEAERQSAVPRRSQPWLDTAGRSAPLLVAIFGWVAEQARGRLRERTMARLERARRQGTRIGRPPTSRFSFMPPPSLSARAFRWRSPRGGRASHVPRYAGFSFAASPGRDPYSSHASRVYESGCAYNPDHTF